MVVDVSKAGPAFGQQMTAVETVIYELRKQVVVLVATKRDQANLTSLQHLVDWASRNKLTLVETSAKRNINIKDSFQVVAAKTLAKKGIKLSDSYHDYASGSGHLLNLCTQAKKDFKEYLKTSVHTSEAGLSSVENATSYQNALNLLGKFTTDEIMACYLLKTRDTEICNYSGVKDNSDMRLEMLEDYIQDMLDFVAHKGSLLS